MMKWQTQLPPTFKSIFRSEQHALSCCRLTWSPSVCCLIKCVHRERENHRERWKLNQDFVLPSRTTPQWSYLLNGSKSSWSLWASPLDLSFQGWPQYIFCIPYPKRWRQNKGLWEVWAKLVQIVPLGTSAQDFLAFEEGGLETHKGAGWRIKAEFSPLY